WYMGQFVVDDTKEWEDHTTAHLSIPAKAGEQGATRDKYDDLGEKVVEHLHTVQGGRFDTVTKLANSLRAKGVKLGQNDLAPALERLANHGTITWPDVPGSKARPGWLPEKDDDE